jgi:hypothetical protein
MALTEQRGLANWWTGDTVAEPTEGSVAEFGFGQRRTVIRMRIEELVSPSLVRWQCLGGIDEWIGTNLRFELKSVGDGTQLMFRHLGWKSSDGVLALCSFDWAHYLMSLRSYCESGQGNPHMGVSAPRTAPSTTSNKEPVRR